jgi:hypothetical protein
MLMRKIPYGGWLWIQNIALHAVGGVQMRSMSVLLWGFGKISVGA